MYFFYIGHKILKILHIIKLLDNCYILNITFFQSIT